MKNKIRLSILCCLMVVTLSPSKGQQKIFNHPGILHSRQDLERIRRTVLAGQSPAYNCYAIMASAPYSDYDYKMQGPFRIIARQDRYKHTKVLYELDHKAAYFNALMWICKQEERHAAKAVEILNAYAREMEQIEPTHNDAPLCAAIQGFMLVNAAEILRYTYDVPREDIEAWEGMFRNVFLPVLRWFFDQPAYTNGNWGAIAVKAQMGIGIFLDERALYDEAVDFYLTASDNGSIGNYISLTGQCQESGRDQSHVMLGLGSMAEACEVTYHQGDDLYSALDNRLLKGFEYTAKYNLGYDDVPFEKWTDVTGKYSDWETISEDRRGCFRPIFEMAYNHYSGRMGLAMPYTQEVIEKKSYEGEATFCDHPGYGTLLFRSAD